MSNIYDNPKPTEPADFFVYPPKENHIIMTPQNELDDLARYKKYWADETFKQAIIKLAGE